MFKGLFFSVSLFFLGSVVVHAQNSTSQTYYVSPSGSDSNLGTMSAPLKTVSVGISKMSAGDTLYLRKGTYSGFSVSKSGAANKYLTIAGYPGEMPTISGGTGIKLSGTSYVAIKNLEVTGASYAWGAAITVMDSSNILIEGNKVHDNMGPDTTGIIVSGGKNNQVLHNEVFKNEFVGIRIYGNSSVTGNELGYNKVYSNNASAGDSDGIDCDGGAVGANIHHNIIYDNSDDGLDMWNCPGNTISNNISYNNGGTGDGNGFKLGGGASGGGNLVKQNISYNNRASGFDSNASGGNQYYNNVAYGNATLGFDDSWRTNSPSLSTFVNNIGYNNGVADVWLKSGLTGTSHNNAWGKMKWNNTLYSGATGIASFYQASGFDNPNGGDKSSFSTDPLFTNPVLADFSLLPNSPLVGKGELTANGLKDLGAIPYAGTSAVAPSPTPGPKPGDTNSNNIVDEADLATWKTSYLTAPLSLGYGFGDFDNNGKVDGVDYMLWINNYGK